LCTTLRYSNVTASCQRRTVVWRSTNTCGQRTRQPVELNPDNFANGDRHITLKFVA